jgi:alkyl hydroperoxide reductase subunit AhpF
MSRPTLSEPANVPEAHRAVTELVAELQRGWDTHDAEISNRHFAQDVLWGGPFGASVTGYARLHAIHVRLKAEHRGGASRFEIEHVIAPAVGVAIAQVRRISLADDFSELAMYVLVKRGETWWLAAGQNTKLTPGQSAGGS